MLRNCQYLNLPGILDKLSPEIAQSARNTKKLCVAEETGNFFGFADPAGLEVSNWF